MHATDRCATAVHVTDRALTPYDQDMFRNHPMRHALPLLFASLCLPAHADRVLHDITYTPPGWPAALQADLYRPASAGPHPVVLMVHGGGWRSGSRQDSYVTTLCQALVRAGMACLSASYRLVPEGRHPAPRDDLQQALRWLKREGPAHGLDEQRVGVWGYSAGAHLAALLGTRPAADPEAARVRAVVAGGIPADLRLWPDSAMVNAYLGDTLAAQPRRWAEASPVTQVTAASAPFFIYHGRLDRLVEPAQARLMQEALQSAGVPVTLRWLPLKGHITAALFPGAVTDEAITFLRDHLPARAHSVTGQRHAYAERQRR